MRFLFSVFCIFFLCWFRFEYVYVRKYHKRNGIDRGKWHKTVSIIQKQASFTSNGWEMAYCVRIHDSQIFIVAYVLACKRVCVCAWKISKHRETRNRHWPLNRDNTNDRFINLYSKQQSNCWIVLLPTVDSGQKPMCTNSKWLRYVCVCDLFDSDME